MRGYRPRQSQRGSVLRGLIVLAVCLFVGYQVSGIVFPRLHEAVWGFLFGRATSTVPVVCRQGNVLANVYNPARLTVHKPCVSATGRIVAIIHAPDGDVHLSLLPDRGYWHLLNQRNYTRCGGTLVVEIIPADQKTVAIPKLFSHVRVTGAWVTDNDHNWQELHPAWQIVPVS